jgi:hypothetical protein
MDALDVFDVKRRPDGDHVFVRAQPRIYQQPDGYGIRGQGRIDPEIMATCRILAEVPDVAKYFGGM